jgi:hypothetical protein
MRCIFRFSALLTLFYITRIDAFSGPASIGQTRMRMPALRGGLLVVPPLTRTSIAAAALHITVFQLAYKTIDARHAYGAARCHATIEVDGQQIAASSDNTFTITTPKRAAHRATRVSVQCSNDDEGVRITPNYVEIDQSGDIDSYSIHTLFVQRVAKVARSESKAEHAVVYNTTAHAAPNTTIELSVESVDLNVGNSTTSWPGGNDNNNNNIGGGGVVGVGLASADDPVTVSVDVGDKIETPVIATAQPPTTPASPTSLLYRIVKVVARSITIALFFMLVLLAVTLRVASITRLGFVDAAAAPAAENDSGEDESSDKLY